jgi:hypothetical protein
VVDAHRVACIAGQLRQDIHGIQLRQDIASRHP